MLKLLVLQFGVLLKLFLSCLPPFCNVDNGEGVLVSCNTYVRGRRFLFLVAFPWCLSDRRFTVSIARNSYSHEGSNVPRCLCFMCRTNHDLDGGYPL